MFRKAITTINKFYSLDLEENNHADEVFEILKEIINYDSAGIFYLSPENLTLEFGKNADKFKDIKLSEGLTTKIYDSKTELPTAEIKKAFAIETPILIKRLVVKGAVFGILLIQRKAEFSKDEEMIFTTCTSIISNLIKDLELSKVLKMQVEALQTGIVETQTAYETIKEQNKKIKANEKLQNEFIANISHDLRTPLNSIIGFSELLSNKIFGELNEKQSEYLSDIRIAGLKLLSMINEILDIAKINSHTIKLNQTQIDAELLISEVCNILSPLLNKKGIKIIKQIETNYSFQGDYLKFQQILFNLIGNAIKFSENNSNIIVSIGSQNNNTVIKVKDFGIGIEKEFHKKIFKKFYQIETPYSKTEASTGLGLTITKEFVKLHGGKITVASEPHNGTEFVITLKQK